MCLSAFMSHPCLFYHNPIANIAVRSTYRQSGGENAGIRTEVSNTGSQCWKSDFDFDWKILWDKSYGSNSRIPLRQCMQSPLWKETGWNCGKSGFPLAPWLTQRAFTLFHWPDTTKDLLRLWYNPAQTWAMPSETCRLYSSLAFSLRFFSFRFRKK